MIKLIAPILYKLNYLIQSNRKVRNCYIAFDGKYEGAGAQIHGMISTILFARKFGLEYVHTPLKEVEHHKGDREDWAKRWEVFFSLGKNEKALAEIKQTSIAEKKVRYPGVLNKTADTLFYVHNCHSFIDLIPESYRSFIPELKAKYYLTAKEDFYGNEKVLQIAVHLRRGDVTQGTNRFNRFTSNEIAAQRLKKITVVLRGMEVKFQINIFSVGVPDDFDELQQFDPIFHLNADEFKSFHSLVKADVLIMAKSSFSYVAALLNEGVILYDPFWHSPMKNWINADSPKEVFEERIKRLTH